MTDRESDDRNRSRNSCSGRSRRHRRHHHGRGRKERVLHTRISEQLSDDIRRLADDMRVPVSNLVRNVLEEVFTAVESVSGDVGEFFEDVLNEAEGVRERIRNQQQGAGPGPWRSRRPRPASSEEVEGEFRADEADESNRAQSKGRASDRPDDSDDVLGWQPIVLNRALDCPGCGAKLAPGDAAHIGISSTGKPGRVVCSSCASTS